MSVDIGVPPLRHKNITVRTDVPVKMRDGVTLLADIYRPDTAEPLPVLLMRTPYDKSMAQNTVFMNPAWYARYGYIVVIQDCRGRYSSEGVWNPYELEAADGHDTVEWASHLEGSNGSVAMYGFSYPGAIQLQTAATRPRGLKTIVPAMTASDFFDHWTYEGGVLSQAFILSWVLYLCQDTARREGKFDLQRELWSTFMSLPAPYFSTPVIDTIRDARTVAPYFVEWLDHDTYDEYWRNKSIRNSYSEIELPVLHVGGWYDVFIKGTIENFLTLDKLRQSDSGRGEQKLIVGPWHHLPWQQYVGSCDFGVAACNVVNPMQLKWLDRHMGYSSAEQEDSPKVQVFVLNANEWRSFDSWPPAGTVNRTYYLHSGGRANSISGDGTLSTDAPVDEPWDLYLHDPSAPVLSQGGHSCCFEDIAPMGPMSQRKNEIRNDVLVYTSAVLDQDVSVMGLVKARFYASSTADDTDFAVMLCDVAECGLSINIVNSIVRASRRNSLSEPELLEPEKVYEFNLDVGWTAALFKKGHRIRVTIASSNFPHFGRTPNKSSISPVDADLNDWKVARQTIYHDSEHPSHLVLPTI